MAPPHYTNMATGIGVTVFGEVLNPWMVLGGAIVIGAGLFAFWRERVRAKASLRRWRRTGPATAGLLRCLTMPTRRVYRSVGDGWRERAGAG